MESLGEHLKKEREARKISLEEISKSTRISIKILQAIESDDKSKFPNKIFSRGFLKTYSKYLGLDEADVLIKYDQFYKDDSTPQSEYRVKVIEDLYENKYKKFVFYFIMLLVVIGIVILAYNPKEMEIEDFSDLTTKAETENATSTTTSAPKPLPEQNVSTEALSSSATPQQTEAQPLQQSALDATALVPNPTQALLPQNPTQVVAPVEQSPPQQVNAPSAPAKGSAPQEPVAQEPAPQESATQAAAPIASKEHKLVFKASANVWVRIQTDENKPYEVILKNGESYKITSKQKFKLKIGNAGKLRIELDGKDIGVMGKDKEVKELTLPN